MFKGKVALVTGASRGIGAETARQLASLGADIAIIYAGSEDKALAVAEQCRALGVRAETYRCDVSDCDAVRETVNAVKADLGGVDILINNAGITRDGLVVVMKQKSFTDVISTNLIGAYNMIRNVSPLMLRKKWGRIVSVSSVAGIMGNAGQANYAASKAGLIGLTKSVARELAPRGITCNAVAPGFIETDMTKDIAANEGLAAAIPLGRKGSAEEVAKAIVFLVQSDYITGEVLRVDGGLAM